MNPIFSRVDSYPVNIMLCVGCFFRFIGNRVPDLVFGAQVLELINGASALRAFMACSGILYILESCVWGYR